MSNVCRAQVPDQEKPSGAAAMMEPSSSEDAKPFIPWSFDRSRLSDRLLLIKVVEASSFHSFSL